MHASALRGHAVVAVRDGREVLDRLEGADHHRSGGAGERLVLDGAGDREQRPLAQAPDGDRVLGAGDGAEDRGVVADAGRGARPVQRGRHRQPVLAVGDDAAEHRHVLVGVDAVAGCGAGRLGEPVALLPHADGRRGDAGALRNVFYRESVHRVSNYPSTRCPRHPPRTFTGTTATGIESRCARTPYLGAMTQDTREPDPILVTGASGYVGGFLISELLRRDRKIRALARDPDRSPQPAGVDVRSGDAVSGRGLREALEGCRTAYYLIHSMGRGSGPTTTSPAATASRRSTSARRRATRASSASSTWAASARPARTPPSTCAPATRSPSCCASASRSSSTCGRR